MEGKKYGADHDQSISFANVKAVLDAEKVKADESHDYGTPDKRTAFLFQEKPQDRYDDYVARGDEACFSHCGVFDAELLEIACKAQENAAADAADK